MIYTVLCTGESLTLEDIEYCRGLSKVVAVSDAIYLAPWADVLVSHDANWWRVHSGLVYDGPKWTCHPGGIPDRDIACEPDGRGNSGALGIVVAHKAGADRILLLGADGKGTHFFGQHMGTGLKNATDTQFSAQREQFAMLAHLPVVNVTPGSLVDCFPRGDLRTELDAYGVDGTEAGS